MGASTKEKAQQIPLDASPESIAKRKKIFRDFDVNGNNWLSLAEIDKGLRDILNFPEVFDAKPVIMRAYQASLKKVRSNNPLTEGLVSRGAFKWTLIYLRFYYELWEDFQDLDTEGQDRRLNEAEFCKGSEKLKNEWKIKVEDPSAKFKELLQKYNAQANITFTEFCEWVILERLAEFDDLNSHDEIWSSRKTIFKFEFLWGINRCSGRSDCLGKTHWLFLLMGFNKTLLGVTLIIVY